MAKTTTFNNDASDNDLDNAANWTNGLPSRATGDTAIIAALGHSGTVSALIMQIGSGGGIDPIIVLDVGRVLVGTSTFYNSPGIGGGIRNLHPMIR